MCVYKSNFNNFKIISFPNTHVKKWLSKNKQIKEERKKVRKKKDEVDQIIGFFQTSL